MKKCPHCGVELAENARFCLHCMTTLNQKRVIPSPQYALRRWLHTAVAVLVFLSVISGVCITGYSRLNVTEGVPSNTHPVTVSTTHPVTVSTTPTTTGTIIITDPFTGESMVVPEKPDPNDTATQTEITDGNQQGTATLPGGVTLPSTSGDSNQPATQSTTNRNIIYPTAVVTVSGSADGRYTTGYTTSVIQAPYPSIPNQYIPSDTIPTSATSAGNTSTSNIPIPPSSTNNVPTPTSNAPTVSTSPTRPVESATTTTENTTTTTTTIKATTATTKKVTTTTRMTTNASSSGSYWLTATPGNTTEDGQPIEEVTWYYEPVKGTGKVSTSCDQYLSHCKGCESFYCTTTVSGIPIKDCIVVIGFDRPTSNGIYRVPAVIDGKPVVEVNMRYSTVGRHFNDADIADTVKRVYLPPECIELAPGTLEKCTNLERLYFTTTGYYFLCPGALPNVTAYTINKNYNTGHTRQYLLYLYTRNSRAPENARESFLSSVCQLESGYVQYELSYRAFCEIIYDDVVRALYGGGS